tara:strand:+ start:86 stop:1387 length:1302 start_codon:yes stop_codon:yes gene_type:complete
VVDFRPFRALRFNTTQTEELGNLICPPYDVISKEDQSYFYSLSRHNAVRLELPVIEKNPLEEEYTSVKTKLNQWLSNNVIARDANNSFYITRHQFSHNGKSHNRYGITGCIRLGGSAQSRVITHEHTAPKPRQDRLVHVQYSQSNISPIMGLYRDNDATLNNFMLQMAQTTPSSQAKLPNNEEIVLWKTDKPDDLSLIQSCLQTRKVHLADGHHRYDAMLQYQRLTHETQTQPNLDDASNFIMITLIPFNDPGLLLLPYHRILKSVPSEIQKHIDQNIQNNFQTISVLPLDPDSQDNAVKTINQLLSSTNQDSIVQIREMKATLLIPNNSQINNESSSDQTNQVVTTTLSWILTECVLKPALRSRYDATMGYEHEIGSLVNGIFNQSANIGFVMKPISLDTFEKLHQATLILPPKSTFFHPKLPAGLTMRELL